MQCTISTIQQFIVFDGYVKEERKRRLGPGGLDPLEVLETLPPVSVSLYSVNYWQ